jgi:hypothetical protein
MVDAQNPSTGSLPDTVPYSRYGGDPADPSWSAAFPQNLYVRWAVDGDATPASTYWSQLQSYFNNIATQVSLGEGARTSAVTGHRRRLW